MADTAPMPADWAPHVRRGPAGTWVPRRTWSSEAAAVAEARRSPGCCAYQCPVCDGWHVSKTTRQDHPHIYDPPDDLDATCVVCGGNRSAESRRNLRIRHSTNGPGSLVVTIPGPKHTHTFTTDTRNARCLTCDKTLWRLREQTGDNP